MKYLVNRETKEHLNYDSVPDQFNIAGWKIVEADEDGWIKWECKKNAECPLPANAKVDLKWIFGLDNFGVIAGAGWNWEGACNNGVTFYRPILPAESKPDIDKMMDDCAERFITEIGSKPTIENILDEIKTEAKVDVFTRLSEAVAASESIPALIAEISAMLPEGYEVTRK